MVLHRTALALKDENFAQNFALVILSFRSQILVACENHLKNQA